MTEPSHRPPVDDSGDYAKVSGPVVVIGFALVMEAILVGLGSMAALIHGLVGMAAGGALMWAGWLLAGLSTGDFKRASIVTATLGVTGGILGLLLTVEATCQSFENCVSAQAYGVFLLPAGFVAFNVVCATLLWRRSVE